MKAEVPRGFYPKVMLFPKLRRRQGIVSLFFRNFDYRLSYSRSENKFYLLLLSLNRNLDSKSCLLKPGILTN